MGCANPNSPGRTEGGGEVTNGASEAAVKQDGGKALTEATVKHRPYLTSLTPFTPRTDVNAQAREALPYFLPPPPRASSGEEVMT